MLAAGTAFTGGWVVLGLTNHGDAFPQGPSAVLLPFVLVAPAVAAWLGWRGGEPGPRRLAGLAVAALLALAFWVLVPNGWWASGPPPMRP